MRKLAVLLLLALGCYASKGHIVINHQYITKDGKARSGQIIVDYNISTLDCADVASKVASVYSMTPEWVINMIDENAKEADVEQYRNALVHYMLDGDVCAKQIKIKTKGN